MVIQIRYDEDNKKMDISTSDGKMETISYPNTQDQNHVHGFASTMADALLHYMKKGLASNAWRRKDYPTE